MKIKRKSLPKTVQRDAYQVTNEAGDVVLEKSMPSFGDMASTDGIAIAWAAHKLLRMDDGVYVLSFVGADGLEPVFNITKQPKLIEWVRA